MKPLLVLTAPIYSRSGYGECARDFAKYLLTKNTTHEIRFVSTKWGSTPDTGLSDDPLLLSEIEKSTLYEKPSREIDIHFHISLPNEFRPAGKLNIGMSAGVETTKCPASYLQGCNHMDMVIVPSKFTQTTLLNTEYVDDTTGDTLKCTTPVKVIFEGYDETFYSPDRIDTSGLLSSELGIIQENFCYLFVGHWMTQYTLGNDRKNIGMLVRTFLETWSGEKNPPGLILKTNGTNTSHIDKSTILKKINEVQELVPTEPPHPNIYLLHGDLSPCEMHQLYNHPVVKCHITLTHGEGFCRPLLEAGLSGRPIVAPKWSGYMDYLDHKHSVLIPGKTEPIDPSIYNNNFVRGAEWFNVDYEQASQMIREVYTNYDKYLQRASKVKNYISTNYTLNKMFDEYDNVLESVLKVK